MSLSKICAIGTALSRSPGFSFKNLSSTYWNSLKQVLPRSTRQWCSKPVTHHKVLKATKLFGVSLTCAPLLRTATCKQATISKRAEKLREDKFSEPEPSLSWSDLWQLLKPYIGYFLAAVVCAILTAAVNIQLPIHLGALIDTIVQLIRDQAQGKSTDLSIINKDALKLVSCYTAQAFLTFMYISFITVLGERMATDLRIRLFDRLLHLDMSFHDHEKSGELSSRLNSDVQEFKSCFKMTISQGLKTFAQTAGCIATLVRLSPQMTMITLAALPLVIAVGTLCGALLRSLSRKSQAQSAVAAGVADEAFGNIRTVKAFAMEKKETELFASEVRKACFMNELLGFGIGIFQAGTNLFLNGIVLSVLYAGSGLIHSGQMTPGDLMSFLVTAQTIQKSLSQLSVIFGHALKGWTAGARVFQFINITPTMRMDDGVCIPYHTLWGQVTFENVGFSYPTRNNHQVLEGLDLDIPAGQIVALCGPSGGGKSTITALVERFYDPTSGRVLLDGKDLRDLNLEWLRGRVIGLISQEPVLFHTTVEENIRYGKPEATEEEIRAAAKLANAHNFIETFPNGYQTVVGERGTLLSGGQKQRIAIARALLKNPPILILDEATSALDTESEKLVRDALEVAMKGRTTIIIAHRLSTIQNANRIYVIKNKKVAEQGTHAELMKKCGDYYRLVESQSL